MRGGLAPAVLTLLVIALPLGAMDPDALPSKSAASPKVRILEPDQRVVAYFVSKGLDGRELLQKNGQWSPDFPAALRKLCADNKGELCELLMTVLGPELKDGYDAVVMQVACQSWIMDRKGSLIMKNLAAKDLSQGGRPTS